MTNAEAMAAAILEIEQILSEYLEPGREQDHAATITRILLALEKDNAVGAAERTKAGYNGPKLVL